jgi:hypothetical protein
MCKVEKAKKKLAGDDVEEGRMKLYLCSTTYVLRDDPSLVLETGYTLTLQPSSWRLYTLADRQHSRFVDGRSERVASKDESPSGISSPAQSTSGATLSCTLLQLAHVCSVKEGVIAMRRCKIGPILQRRFISPCLARACQPWRCRVEHGL